MGLDMYLYKKTYVGSRWCVVSPLIRGVRSERIAYVIEEVGYWRKANQIHGWFVRNVQDGNDDCGEYSVDLAQLHQLLSLCETVLDSLRMQNGEVSIGFICGPNEPFHEVFKDGKVVSDTVMAKRLLPTSSGPFFGSTNYDEYYRQDIEHTIEILREAVKDDYGNYYYHSSW